MNTDVKAPEAKLPEDQGTPIGIKEGTPSPISEGVQSSGAEQATNSDQPEQPTLTKEPKPEDAPLNPGVDATKPVPPANTIDLKVDGSDTAKKAAEERAMQEQQRQEKREQLAAANTLDPNKKTTDNIMGQTAGGLDQPVQNNPAEMPAPNQQVPGNAQNQAQPVKKKPWYKFW